MLSLVRIRGCNLELVEIVKDIELGEVERSVVVASVRMLKDNKVEPSAATLATCCNADFMTNFLKLLADFVQLFGGEGATALC